MKQIKIMEIDNFINATMTHSIETTGRYTFSPSALPYCPILDYWLRRANNNENPVDEQTFIMDFYCDTGTAVHELLQHYGSLVGKKDGKQYGRWKCNKCGTTTKGFKPKKCEHIVLDIQDSRNPHEDFKGKVCNCKSFEYKEIEFDRNVCWGMHAFCDNLIRVKIKDPSTGQVRKCWVLLEYKTKGIEYITNEYKSKYLPDKKHTVQARSYCSMLLKQEGIKVDYVAIVYIPRDAPFDYKNKKALFKTCIFEVTDEMIEQTNKELHRANLSHNYVIRSAESGFKKYKQKFIDLRPCTSNTTYANYMDYAFFGNNECPLKKLCIDMSINKSNINKILDKYNDKLEESV